MLLALLEPHVRLLLVFKPQLLQDQVDELHSELEEYRAQGKILRLPLKNSLSEELDLHSGGIEPDQGKHSCTQFFWYLHLTWFLEPWLHAALLNTGILESREGETLAVSFLELSHLWLGFSFVLEVSIKKNISDFDIADSSLPASVCLV